MCVDVSMCVYMSVCVCVIPHVNTEEGEAPIPSRRARRRQQPQVAQDTVSTLGSLLSPSAAPAVLQHPVGPKETCCVCSAGGNAAPALMETIPQASPGEGEAVKAAVKGDL